MIHPSYFYFPTILWQKRNKMAMIIYTTSQFLKLS